MLGEIGGADDFIESKDFVTLTPARHKELLDKAAELDAIKAKYEGKPDLNVLYDVEAAAKQKDLTVSLRVEHYYGVGIRYGIFIASQSAGLIREHVDDSLSELAERLPDVLRAIEEYHGE
jgi:hypothetical protein